MTPAQRLARHVGFLSPVLTIEFLPQRARQVSACGEDSQTCNPPRCPFSRGRCQQKGIAANPRAVMSILSNMVDVDTVARLAGFVVDWVVFIIGPCLIALATGLIGFVCYTGACVCHMEVGGQSRLRRRWGMRARVAEANTAMGARARGAAPQASGSCCR